MVTSAVLRAALFNPRVLGGVTSGAYHALSKQALIKSSSKLTAEYVGTRSVTNKFISGGLADIEASGLRTALNSASPYKGAFDIITNNVKGKGLALLGLYALGGVGAAIAGFSLAIESYGKFSDLQNGIPRVVDTCREPWMHGALAASGLAMGVGGLLMFTPLASVGMTLAIGGAVATAGLKIFKYLAYGVHVFKYPETAPWPLSPIIRTFARNPNGVR